MGSFRGWAAARVIRHRWSVVVAWLLAAAVLLPSALHVEDGLEVSTRPLGSESAEVDQALAERFHSPFARNAILVVSGVPGPSHPEGLAALREIVEALKAQPGVIGTFSYLDQPVTYFEGQGRAGTFLLVGLDRGQGRVDQRLPELRAAMAAVADRLRARHAGLGLRFTGESAINVDLWRTSTNEARTAERRALPSPRRPVVTRSERPASPPTLRTAAPSKTPRRSLRTNHLGQQSSTTVRATK